MNNWNHKEELPEGCHLYANREGFKRPTTQQAVNDNVPPAYQREPEQVLAWPTLERLAHRKDRKRVDALLFWRDLTQPHNALISHNREAADEVDGDLEFEHEIRPTEPAALKAIGWKVIGKERWHFNGKRVHTYERADTQPVVIAECAPVRKHIQLGELRFHGNEMVEWGRTANGKPLKPISREGAPFGLPVPKRTDAAIWRYIRLPAALDHPMEARGIDRVPVSACGAGGNGSYYDPLPGVEKARALLAELMKDAPPITRCPDALVSGKQWKGGVPAMKGTGGTGRTTAPDIGHSAAASELVRIAEAERLRRELGRMADILDMAITDATAEEVGLAAGRKPEGAKKYGTQDIELALDTLIAVAKLKSKPVADNDNENKVQKMAA
jgi:hypothetical protein